MPKIKTFDLQTLVGYERLFYVAFHMIIENCQVLTASMESLVKSDFTF